MEEEKLLATSSDEAEESKDTVSAAAAAAPSSTTTSASGSNAAKENWHSRKISWGKDVIMGQHSAANNGGGGVAQDNHNNNYTSPAFKSSPAAEAATLAALKEQQGEDSGFMTEEDPDVVQARQIQSLFAGQGGGTYNGVSDDFRRKHVSSLGELDLDDVLRESPYENEAETYILRAIEDRERTTDGGNSGAQQSILGNIPDDAMSALSNQSGSNDGVSNDGDDRGGDDHGDGNDENISKEPPVSSSNMTDNSSGRPTLSEGSRRSSVRINASQFNDHRRNQTMESQLFGLASAIDAMQAQNWNTTAGGGSGGWRNNLSAGANVSDNNNGQLGSAEALQQNASLLYNRGNKNRARLDSGGYAAGDDMSSSSDQGTNHSPTPSGRRRNMLVNMGKSFRHLHKTTDSDLSADSGLLGNSSHRYAADGAPLNSLQLSDIEEGGEEQDNLINDPDQHEVPTHQEGDKGGAHKKGKRKQVERQLVRELQDFFAPQKTTIVLFFRVMFIYIALPLMGIAAILFYWGDCPPMGRLAYGGKPVNGTLWNIHGEKVGSDEESVSWWLIFVVRLIVTFTFAKALEKFFIDYLTIRTRGTITLCGPWVTLLLLQSRGWPSTLFLWGLLNFCLLSGPSEFAQHWAYWQTSIGMFNRENASGDVLNSEWMHRILAISVALGILVAFKRLLLGLYLGKRTFNAYADQLSKVMKNILMISEIAALAKDFEYEMKIRAHRKGVPANQYVNDLSSQRDKLFGIFEDMDDDAGSNAGGISTADKSSNHGGGTSNVDYIVDKEDRNPWSGALSNAQQNRIIRLLGAWEEPVIAERKVEYISVSALLQFRRSMACLHTQFPFSGSFGLADTRENCIQSAQDVYRRLLLNDPDKTELNFETLALLGLQRDGTLNQPKLKEMIRLFRPNRDGSLNILEFVKSIDTVYKELRMLRASVTNASRIDQSFETIFNFIFYAIVIVIILSQLGYSPMAMFLSISGVILAFAFMIGSASSKYFEGLLFILVRRPYAIGDGIAVSNIESEGAYTGHPFWYVEDVTLFTTSVMYFYTGERATLSNGSLANSRIINASRTPMAYMYILLKFPVDVSHDKLKIFHTALEQFFRNRPREWRSFDSFRATRIDTEAGFIEYMVVGTHRLSWIEWTTIHVSKADLINFCSELSKKLGIWYRAPPVPVDLTFKNSANLGSMLPGQPALPEGTNMPSTPMSSTSALPEPDLSGLQAMFPPRS